jgi:hypothetical protein
MKNFKRWQVVLFAVILLLVVSNPSITSFKANQGAESYDGLIRKYNFFICSIYECKNGSDAWESGSNGTAIRGRYIGVLGNFFMISPLSSERPTE